MKQQLTIDGEYQASVYFIGANTTSIQITTNMQESKFVTHSYVKSPALSEAAVFVSRGYFVDDDIDGNYRFHYIMEEDNSPTIIEPSKANFYLGMVGRVGLPLEEDITLLYHNDKISIFDMNRNNSVIMFSKKH
ncbi:hypothetical protein [Aeromonas salmonicida]|uniref:hypothetical protein n=1 Tax=Aeromonas salmonicida TaxID=645 RepID=UPI003D199ABF